MPIEQQAEDETDHRAGDHGAERAAPNRAAQSPAERHGDRTEDAPVPGRACCHHQRHAIAPRDITVARQPPVTTPPAGQHDDATRRRHDALRNYDASGGMRDNQMLASPQKTAPRADRKNTKATKRHKATTSKNVRATINGSSPLAARRPGGVAGVRVGRITSRSLVTNRPFAIRPTLTPATARSAAPPAGQKSIEVTLEVFFVALRVLRDLSSTSCRRVVVS